MKKIFRILTLASIAASLIGAVLDQGKGAPSQEAEAALANVMRGLEGKPPAPDGEGRGQVDPMRLLGVLSTD